MHFERRSTEVGENIACHNIMHYVILLHHTCTDWFAPCAHAKTHTKYIMGQLSVFKSKFYNISMCSYLPDVFGTRRYLVACISDFYWKFHVSGWNTLLLVLHLSSEKVSSVLKKFLLSPFAQLISSLLLHHSFTNLFLSCEHHLLQ